MGHTNETANVELSQFLGTDKPAWLVDYNGDMAKIDAYAYATKVKADANESAITSLGNRVTTVENDITNIITPALTAAQNNITTLQGNITTINSLIGNGTPTTTDQTIIGAINEINGNLNKCVAVDTVNHTLTGGNTEESSTVDLSKPGYTPLAVVGWYQTFSYTLKIVTNGVNVGQNSTYLTVSDDTNIPANSVLRLYVLYIKNAINS